MEILNFFSDLDIKMILGFTIGIIIGSPILFLYLSYKLLAPRNILFTFGRENRAMYVMVGRKWTGRVILPSKTIYVEKKSYDIKEYSGNQKAKILKKGILGMYWVGIPPFYSIYERRQQWLEWKSVNGGGREIILRDEVTPFLICKPFEYAMKVEEAEDANGMPLDIFFTVTLEPVNAVRPIFRNDNAYGQVQTKCISEVLLFTKTQTFSTLGGSNPTITKDDFSSRLCSLNNSIPGSPDGITDILGYKIIDAKLDKVEVSGTKKAELLETSILVYTAGEKAKAKVIDAEAEKQSKILEAEGKKIAGMLGIDVEKYDMEIRKDFYEKIKKMPYAQQIELAKKMFSDSNLTTFVSGKDVTPTINIK